MFGKFECRQCGRNKPYGDIVKGHYICLNCYYWALGVWKRNEGKTFGTGEREVEILFGTYTDSPLGSSRMLTSEEAEYILLNEEQKDISRPTMWTCKMCRHYRYKEDKSVDPNVCKKCYDSIQRKRR